MSNFEYSYSGFRRCTSSHYMYNSDLRKSLRYSHLSVLSHPKKIKVHNLKVCDFLEDRSEENSIPDIKVSLRYISRYTANSVDSYIYFSLFSSLHNSEVISEK